ncbi:MAG TPA: metalloregulator ArsR/SmtB family transcription factor, partial [Tepidiformaceae bacterium]|nr:metalloregulator ArsR/SmtB family transcription factor [Tepidiformaceae bacterium]
MTIITGEQILKSVLDYSPVAAVFRALADPTRMALVERLSRGAAAVSTLAEPFDASLTAIGQHIAVLEEAGLG